MIETLAIVSYNQRLHLVTKQRGTNMRQRHVDVAHSKHGNKANKCGRKKGKERIITDHLTYIGESLRE